ncbi:MAG: hypothetical protein GWN00_17680, partial [Aliifodinibius sp.]|nr:hypothetical protein [Fodinibius sp.]NIV12841.1 hypothetical protein [Fodinibius sp.]NIY26567.1 hypothetical protein [Fodinibius sp.]
LHAFKLDGSGEAPGFPLRPTGFTYMNGAELGDINNDGILDVATISYNDQYTYSNVWSLGVSYQPEKILFDTYHSNLARNGLSPEKVQTSIHTDGMNHNRIKNFSLSIFPNPMNPTTVVQVQVSNASRIRLDLFDITGRRVRTVYKGDLASGEHRF